ncbi:MAG: 30S ribosome-binding factor RbfA [Pseudomonadota bacterium]
MKKRFHSQGPSQRQLRAGELIRHALADILRRDEVRDPDVAGASVTVTEVSASPDLKNATVYVMPLGGRDQDTVLAGLNRSAKFLRGQLGREIDMKHTPALTFRLDQSFDEGDKVEALLRSEDVRRDLD